MSKETDYAPNGVKIISTQDEYDLSPASVPTPKTTEGSPRLAGTLRIVESPADKRLKRVIQALPVVGSMVATLAVAWNTLPFNDKGPQKADLPPSGAPMADSVNKNQPSVDRVAESMQRWAESNPQNPQATDALTMTVKGPVKEVGDNLGKALNVINTNFNPAERDKIARQQTEELMASGKIQERQEEGQRERERQATIKVGMQSATIDNKP